MRLANPDYMTLYFSGSSAADGDTQDAAKDNAAKDTHDTPDDDADDDDDRTTPKYSDDDLDRILSRRFKRWSKQQAAAVDEARKLANMTAQERAEHERDELQKELDELKRANAVAEMERTARNILQSDGVTIPDEIVSNLVGDDADATSANVKAFAKAFKAAVQDEVKRQLSHKTPAAGSDSGQITKADILKETDPIKRQKLIRDNLSLFGR